MSQWFDFYAKGDDQQGFTSASGGSRLYIDKSIPYDPDPAPCQ